MTKKKVTTTYRREFSPERSASRPSVIKTFDANFNYREYRRQVEHGHHKSPFVWDDWEYDLQDQPVQPNSGAQRKTSKRIQAEIPSVASSSSSEVVVESDSSEGSAGGYDRHSPSLEVRGRRLRQPSMEPSCSDCNCGVERSRKTRGQGQPERVLSDTISKSLKKVSKKSSQSELDRPKSAPIDESPFVQYGMGDDEEETGQKRTHNVLSRQGVYPTAVGAKMRHQSAKELRSHLVRASRSKTTLHDPRFDDKMNKQTSRWQSEYNKHYKQYPTSQYI